MSECALHRDTLLVRLLPGNKVVLYCVGVSVVVVRVCVCMHVCLCVCVRACVSASVRSFVFA